MSPVSASFHGARSVGLIRCKISDLWCGENGAVRFAPGEGSRKKVAYLQSRTWTNVLCGAVAALAIFFVSRAGAQVAGATLSGKVTDPTGSNVPGVDVNIKNEATGIDRQVHTDSQGLFAAPNLQPGSYAVSFQAQGFAPASTPHIVLAVGDERTLNVQLQIGQVSQQVTVTAAGEVIQLTSSTDLAEVNPTTMRELPLNGRDWTQLATLQPGVTAVRAQAGSSGVSSRGNRGFGNQLSDGGHRPSENNYRVNGLSINDYTNGSPGSALGVQLGVDAIDQFSILTGNYSAEYGRTSGGVINAITKSGTNQVHGTAYYFLRSSKFDARNYFDPAQIPPFHRNQFGASGGAPIRKNKTFVFADYEGVRQDKSLSFYDRVPSAAARAGHLCSAPTSGTCTPNTIVVDPTVAKYLPLYPLPSPGNPSAGDGDIGFFSGSGLAQLTEDYVTAKIDNTFSDKDTVAVSGFFDTSHLTQPDALLVGIHQVSSKRDMFDMEENHVFTQSLTNTLHFGYSRTEGYVNQPVAAINPLGADPTLGALPGRNAPSITTTGLTQEAGSLGTPSYSHHVQNSFQGYDDAFLIHGLHTFKAGVAFERLQYNVVHASGPNGNFNFPSLSGFLQNQPTSVSALLPGTSQEYAGRQSILGFYFQDDWHILPRVTVNLGVRYEITTLPKEANNRFAVLQTLGPGVSATPNVPSLWQNNQTLKNFVPRVGMAWDPFGDGKTSIRAGFGIFDVLPLLWEYSFNAASSYPFGEKGSASKLPKGSFPTGATLIANNPTKFQETYVEQHPKRNYAMNWNLNLQRTLSASTNLTVGYVGSHTVHQPFTVNDANMQLPTQTPYGYLWPASGGTRFDTSVGAIIATWWDDSASYQSLRSQLSRQMTKGWQAQASFTWSKCIDEGTSGSVADPFSTSITSLIWFDKYARRGRCDFDVTDNFVANTVYQVPGPAKGIGRALLGGWEVNGIISASTGSPTSVTIGGDPLGQASSDTYSQPNRLTGNGCSGNPVNPGNVKNYFKLQCFTVPIAPSSLLAQCTPSATGVPGSCMNLFGNAGRNSIIGPGLLDLDASLFKNFYFPKVSDDLRLQLRAEFFNVINHSNFQVPNFADGNQVLYNQDGTPAAGAGVIDATSIDNRQIQFGAKVVW